MGRSDLSPTGNALAGALSGIISGALVYPLDTVKTRIQADTKEAAKALEKALPEPAVKRNGAPRQIPLSLKPGGMRSVAKRILEEQGIAGFFRGFNASMLNTFMMQFAYFYWSTVVRNTYVSKVYPKLNKGSAAPKSLSTATELTLSALAGAFTTLFLNPVGVVATRQQLEESHHSQSIWQTIKDILHADGITGLWRGIRPGLVLTVNPAITYGMFNRIKDLLYGAEAKMTPGRAFVVGALSKTLATVITFPYIMAKVRLQAKYVAEVEAIEYPEESGEAAKTTVQIKKERYKGALDVLSKTYKEKGIAGWYQGMQAQIIKAVLAQALLFGIKDEMEGYTAKLLNIISLLIAIARSQL